MDEGRRDFLHLLSKSLSFQIESEVRDEVVAKWDERKKKREETKWNKEIGGNGGFVRVTLLRCKFSE